MTQQLPRHPVGDGLRLTAGGAHRLFVVVGERAIGDEDPRVVLRERVLLHEARAARGWQLGDTGAQTLDELARRLERDEVGLREVAVVLDLLLRSLEEGPPPIGTPADGDLALAGTDLAAAPPVV